MKVNEIIFENTLTEEQMLTEAAPAVIAAAVPWVVWTLATMSAVELMSNIAKVATVDDPTTVDDETWNQIYFDLAIMLIPAAGPYIKGPLKKAVRALVPDKILAKGGTWLRARVIKQFNAKKDKANWDKGPLAQQMARNPKQAAKMELKRKEIIKKARTKANKQVSVLKNGLSNTGIFKVIAWTSFSYIVTKFYFRFDELSEIYSAIESGDEELLAEMYPDLTKEQALKEIMKERDDLSVQLIGSVSGLIAAVPAVKLGSLGVRFLTKFVPGSRTTMVLRPAQALKRMLESNARQVGILIGTFAQTEAGKQLLSEGYLYEILLPIGQQLPAFQNSLAKLVTWLGSQIGIEGAGDSIKSDIPPSTATVQQKRNALSTVEIAKQRLRLKQDPKNPKILFVDRYQVTDENGFLKTNIPGALKAISDLAARNKLPNPLDKIPKK